MLEFDSVPLRRARGLSLPALRERSLRYGVGTLSDTDLLALVLSGANQDGAAGLKYVAAAGGLTLVQRPDSAVASQMPAAALSAAPQSWVLDLKELGATLGTLHVEGRTKVRS